MNPMIALGVQPPQFQQPEPRTNAMMRVLQLKGAMDQQELHGLQMQETRRKIADETALNEAYAAALGPDGTPDRNKLFSTLANKGLGSKIPGVQKSFAEADKAQGEVRKQAAESYKTFQATLGSHFNNPNLTKDSVLQSVNGLVEAGAFDRNVAGKLVANMPDEPNQLRGYLRQVLSSQMTPEQMLTAFAPKAEKMDDGQRVFFRDTNPNSPTYGQQTAGAATQKVATPDAVLSSATSIENNKRSVGASLANAAATREVAAATRDAASIKDKRDAEMKLGDDYRAQSKNFKEVVDAGNRVKAALPGANKSAASTLAAATSFMKLLDPGSVVRESELGMALAATGALDRALNYVNVLQRGMVLTPQQIQDFTATTEKILQAAAQGQRAVDTHYRGQAQQYGLRPEMIVQELGQSRGTPTAPGMPSASDIEAELARRARK